MANVAAARRTPAFLEFPPERIHNNDYSIKERNIKGKKTVEVNKRNTKFILFCNTNWKRIS